MLLTARGLPVKMVQCIEDLPNVDGDIAEVFCDAETTSGSPNRMAVKPYHGDQIGGLAFTMDDAPMSWYIPVRYNANLLWQNDVKCLPMEVIVAFMRRLLRKGRDWINHNIKFDAHFFAKAGIEFEARMICSLAMAKVVDRQSRGGKYSLHPGKGYGLKELAVEWLGESPEEKAAIDAFLKSIQSRGQKKVSKDYGDIPPDLSAEYGAGDVVLNRTLWKEIKRRRYEGDEKVWNLEIACTGALFRMERRGLRIDTDKLPVVKREAEGIVARLESEFRADFNFTKPNNFEETAEFVTKTLNLPTVAVTKHGGTSTGYDAIVLYRGLPEVAGNPKLLRFFKMLEDYRDRAQFLGLYAEGWQNWIDSTGFIHPAFRQIVASGRMACGEPNVQQLNGEAKSLVIPDSPYHAFTRRDYSQIEYRIIAVICREGVILNAYRTDPKADFHALIAQLCGIERSPAKTVNFGIAFGMGEGGVIRALARLLGGHDAEQRGASILADYHRRFPRIKPTARWCRGLVEKRGFIRTLYGRERAIAYEFARIAFNSAVQGTAADILKDRFVALDSDPLLNQAGVLPRALVHDEALLCGPADAAMDPEVNARIDALLPNPMIELGVPLYTEGGMSRENWKLAG